MNAVLAGLRRELSGASLKQPCDSGMIAATGQERLAVSVLNKTTHTIMTDQQGEGYHVSVTHDDYAATQYEFYIPEAIWNHKAVRTLLRRLEAFAPGATAFSRLSGVWDHKPEATRIYRMVLRAGQFDPVETRSVLHDEVGRLMADLSADPGCAQDVFMFTETPIRVTMSNGPVRT